MNLRSLAPLAAILLSGAAAHAAGIPYPNPGTPIAASTYTAMGGDIQAQFVGFVNKTPPAFTDTISIYDATTGKSTAQIFNNKTTAVGATYDFGTFAKGDVLDFEITVSPNSYFPNGTMFSSDPKRSADGYNHAYTTAFAGGQIAGVYGNTNNINFMSGIFVGMEDYTIPNGGLTDYNDDSYIFTNVSPAATPEPSSLVLLGTGALTAMGAIRRRFRA